MDVDRYLAPKPGLVMGVHDRPARAYTGPPVPQSQLLLRAFRREWRAHRAVGGRCAQLSRARVQDAAGGNAHKREWKDGCADDASAACGRKFRGRG